MSISMYQAFVPPVVHSLRNLKGMLEKATVYAEAKNINPTVLVNARLYPDMFPLSRQVQIAADIAKNASCRLAGIEPPKFEDNESTFPELMARLEKSIALIETFRPEQIDGTEGKVIHLPMHDKTTLTFNGLSYLLNFVIPNVYFHVSTAYAILRHNGMEIGKQDFLGKIA